jgi:hypothetical protein
MSEMASPLIFGMLHVDGEAGLAVTGVLSAPRHTRLVT